MCRYVDCTRLRWATRPPPHLLLDLAIISGCLCTLGIIPIPIALLIAFATRRWFRGRRPVALECLIRPVSVMNSPSSAKFCSSPMISSVIFQSKASTTELEGKNHMSDTHLVLLPRIEAQLIKHVPLRLPLPWLPLRHLHATEVVRRVHVTPPPRPVHLLLKFAALDGLLHRLPGL